MSNLPGAVVKQDRELDAKRTRVTEELMKLRWHWTLDESNSERVSIREYARQVGRSDTTVRMDAQAHVLLVDAARAGASTLTASEARERANMGAETEAAAAAVAEAKGVPFKTARTEHYDDVKQVREIARETAEEKGTSVADEVGPAAEHIARIRRTDEKQREERRERHSLRYIEAEGKVHKAQRALMDVLNLAQEVDFDEEEVELLGDSIGKLKALVGLIDLKLAGSTDVDWDAELTKLGEVK